MKTFRRQQVQESIDLERSIFEMETDHILTQGSIWNYSNDERPKAR